VRPDLPVVATTFRPNPIEPVAGKRVFFATTAPPAIIPKLVAHLEAEHGCTVVATSANLSDRALLRVDMAANAGCFDVLLTELKAAAIDVVAEAGEESGVPTILCDNVPMAVDGTDLGALVDRAVALASERAGARGKVLP
jgi:cyclic 2,3-diphosphoglycerate synthetase